MIALIMAQTACAVNVEALTLASFCGVFQERTTGKEGTNWIVNTP